MHLCEFWKWNVKWNLLSIIFGYFLLARIVTEFFCSRVPGSTLQFHGCWETLVGQTVTATCSNVLTPAWGHWVAVAEVSWFQSSYFPVFLLFSMSLNERNITKSRRWKCWHISSEPKPEEDLFPLTLLMSPWDDYTVLQWTCWSQQVDEKHMKQSFLPQSSCSQQAQPRLASRRHKAKYVLIVVGQWNFVVVC